MTAAILLAPDLAVKLAKVLGMLGSDHDGEVAAAGRRAHAIIQSAGLTWDDVIAPAARSFGSRRCWRPLPPGVECAAQCLCWPEVLTDWEAEFCRSLVGRRWLSPKQTAVLVRIAAKVETFARATGEC